jgi:hypothetical protein
MFCSKCRMKQIQEFYVAPVTASYPQWVNTITEGNTRPFVDTVRIGNGAIAKGAVLPGHVRQNVMTANFPYTPISIDNNPDIPEWNS